MILGPVSKVYITEMNCEQNYNDSTAVSYTHLDVYKRQVFKNVNFKTYTS